MTRYRRGAVSPVKLSHILIHRRDPCHRARRVPRRRAMPVRREPIAIALRRIAMQRPCHEEVLRERRERRANIVVVGQPRRRDRTGCKVAQIPTKTPGVIDAVCPASRGCRFPVRSPRRQRCAASTTDWCAFREATCARLNVMVTGNVTGRCARHRRPFPLSARTGTGPCASTISTISRPAGAATPGGPPGTRTAELGVRDAGTTDDLLANLGVLHVGRTVADRAHDDVDRRRGVNDNRAISRVAPRRA